MSLERAAYYVVREIWLEADSVSGAKTVVVEVQGVRGDGSYWVTGFQVRIPYDRFVTMTDAEFDGIIMAEMRKNEEALKKARNDVVLSTQETEALRKTDKYKSRVGKQYTV
jgi:hypothetical protein